MKSKQENFTPMLKKICLILFLIFVAMFFAAWKFSPYKKMIHSSVGIDLPCKASFDYLGNSANAATWSVFVDFIEPINEDAIPDGEVGSKRVCYTNKDKSGFHWEEEVLEVIENKYRKLSCYNYNNLWMKAPELITEQIYTQTDYGCKLSFTLVPREKLSFIELIKLKLSAYRIKSIFDRNLQQIQEEVQKLQP